MYLLFRGFSIHRLFDAYDEFDNSTLEQKKMIVCQLVKEIRIARGYEIEIVFDIIYEQFIADAQ